MRVAASCEGLGHDADAAHAGEQEDAVAQLLALHEEVDGEDDDDADGADGAEEAHEELGGRLELGAAGVDDADGLDLRGRLLGGGSGGGRRFGEVSADVVEGVDGLLEGLFQRGSGRRRSSAWMLSR